MILIAASRDDPHAAAVIDRLRALDRRVVRLDTAELTGSASLELGFGGGHHPELHLHADHRDAGERGAVDLARAGVGWWRRTGNAAAFRSGADAAALRASREVLEGVIASLALDWLNPPSAEDAARHTLLQWTAAAELGFDLPRTIVTRDPDRARAFALEHAETGLVTKSLRPEPEAGGRTHRLEASDLEGIDRVRQAPTLLQEYVEGVDLRVVVVGDEAFAAEIDGGGPVADDAALRPWDLRRGAGAARIRATDLPGSLGAALSGLARRLGLGYATVDLRRTADDRHVLLDLDPAGSWLFVERATGLPITAAVAGELSVRDGGTRETLEVREPRVVAGAGVPTAGVTSA